MTDKISIDQLIRDSIEKLNADIEIRKSLFLSILHRNIDALVSGAEKWFGTDVPQDYIEILNSLVNFSVMFSDQIQTFNDVVQESSYEVIRPSEIIHELTIDFIEMINMRNFTAHYEEAEILTSRQVFKDSIYNIFLCISQFYKIDSSCEIEILKKATTIHIDFIFSALSEQMPDITKLLRIFFTQKKNDESNVDYKMRLGLNIAVENLKRIGGNFNITSTQGGNVTVYITFPSNDFLESVNDIRKHYLEMAVREHTGRVYLYCEDKVMELLLSENLADNGYKVKRLRPEKILGDADYAQSDAIIVDAGALHHMDQSQLNIFFNQYPDKKIVYITRSRENVVSVPHVYNAVVPFEIESITEFIQH